MPQSEPDSSDGCGGFEPGNGRSFRSRGHRGTARSEVGVISKKDRSSLSPRRDKCGMMIKKEREETARLLDKAAMETEDDDGESHDFGLIYSKGEKENLWLLTSDIAKLNEDKHKNSKLNTEKDNVVMKEQGSEVSDEKKRRRELGLIVATERKWRRRENFHFGSSVRGDKDASKIHHCKRASGPCEIQAVSVVKRNINSFRSRRKSFGSESEKRRGERFQREREMEQMGHSVPAQFPSEDEDDDFDFDFDEESSDSTTHVCDFSCPLVLHGPCPKSLPGGKKRLKGGCT